MKFNETHFEEYITSVEKFSFHPKIETSMKKLPDTLMQMPNLIFYGPSGVGKYSQMLKAIQRYSPSKLKYEKKINIVYNKQTYSIKISDIHYEVDMSLLGCNAKLFWHEIYSQIVDIISVKSEKNGIIVCKTFHEIHNELLYNFYSYMQKDYFSHVEIKWIILTEQVSFIPKNIFDCYHMISVPRPSKSLYNKWLKNNNLSAVEPIEIANIKYCYSFPNTNASSILVDDMNMNDVIENISNPQNIIVKKILMNINPLTNISFSCFREILYDMLIYNIDIYVCILDIITKLIESKKITNANISAIFIHTYDFFKYYNNNYRPIYHLERYFLILGKMMEEPLEPLC
jgi:Cdc6-like AAA superfamily ATPase